ncbi:ATP-binding protein [Ectopseudomonas mendocina]|uniref:histidine kinase n=1 Tax=Ectopseudomonas mendocina TaxID=300 RepID=A0ABZ2RGQ6_ECTME
MQYPTAPPHCIPSVLTVKPRLVRRLSLIALMLMLTIGCGIAGFYTSEYFGIQNLSENGQRQLELNARSVESEISKYTYLPSLLELEFNVERLLSTPTTYRRHLVNEYLEGLNQRSGSLAIYILNPQGRVLATSNWQDATSYLGEDLSFRAYFKDAMEGRAARFYGIGSTAGEPGYYLAHALKKGNRIIGVAVVKVRLEGLEQRWQKARLQAYVSDENGIIILSSNESRWLKAVRPLDATTRERLARSLQYHWWALEELQPLTRRQLADGSELVSFDEETSAHSQTTSVTYLSQSRPLVDTPWHMTLLSPIQDVRRAAYSHALLAGVACALLIFLALALNQRRRMIATRLAAREALIKANNELERKIAERTADLQASNQRLQAEVREREQAETTLRQTQDDLIQAGKLAVIGQMSTAIAHELNQPLAALRTLSGNTIRFLQRGVLDVASSNLQTIGELVDRMGKITGSLRAFARRADDHGQASLEQAIDAALKLLESHSAYEGLIVQRDCQHDGDDSVLGIEQTRLEQILINLIANALDAMIEQNERQLCLTGRPQGERYLLTVQDNGSGIPVDIRAHLFEPFFTTKPGEKGLGLGLTLSASLAAAANGNLSVQHPENGGTAFLLNLPIISPHKDAPHD